jgi:hypothetical protein
MEEKAETKYWWIKDLIDSETKAMGTYLALLYLLTKKGSKDFDVKPSMVSIMNENEVKQLFTAYFAGREADAGQALEAAKLFIDRLFEYENVLKSAERNKILCEIETEFYENFVKAFKKYIKLNRIPIEWVKEAGEILLDVRTQRYGKSLTPAGTFCTLYMSLMYRIKEHHRFGEWTIDKLLSHLVGSGLAVAMPPEYIFPAPCLSDEVIEPIMKLIGKFPFESKMPTPYPPKLEILKVEPSREILEGIVASVFKDLGFEVSTNVRKESRQGSPIEVDVWAWKRIAGTKVSIYVSCKNWNKAIDRPLIDEEIGRVLNLRELPHLKVIIAKELTIPAKEAAEANGFIIIELGKKAEANDVKEIYELVFKTLNELFMSATPSKLREIT